MKLAPAFLHSCYLFDDGEGGGGGDDSVRSCFVFSALHLNSWPFLLRIVACRCARPEGNSSRRLIRLLLVSAFLAPLERFGRGPGIFSHVACFMDKNIERSARALDFFVPCSPLWESILVWEVLGLSLAALRLMFPL